MANILRTIMDYQPSDSETGLKAFLDMFRPSFNRIETTNASYYAISDEAANTPVKKEDALLLLPEMMKKGFKSNNHIHG